MITLFLLFFLFLCWGSFLNVVGYRLIHGYSIVLPRSFCPQCTTTLAWYDLIPVLSWLILRGKCRSCKKAISPLYPLIELLTGVVFTALLLYIEPQYWFSYGLFFSALIVTIRTDAETMLISRYTTLAVLPIAFLLSWLTMLPLSILKSVSGALFGYALLWSIAKVFYLVRKQEGMGEGDFELLATIGSFLGLYGVWITLFLGAFLGSIIGMIVVLKGASLRTTKIPFGPWLALGAIIYTFFQNSISNFYFF
jgi:leader peptidase (prepilin peptidase) / N-methyltransferase